MRSDDNCGFRWWNTSWRKTWRWDNRRGGRRDWKHKPRWAFWCNQFFDIMRHNRKYNKLFHVSLCFLSFSPFRLMHLWTSRGLSLRTCGVFRLATHSGQHFFLHNFFVCPLLVYYFARGGETLIELLSCLFNLPNDIWGLIGREQLSLLSLDIWSLFWVVEKESGLDWFGVF